MAAILRLIVENFAPSVAIELRYVATTAVLAGRGKTPRLEHHSEKSLASVRYARSVAGAI
jgi:hypothetical protein